MEQNETQALGIEELLKWNNPTPYEPGEPMFWTDPHISAQMLEAHLSQDTDAASYRSGRIDAVCSWLQRRIPLGIGDRIADLGCGPGLYSLRLARARCCVTGMDFSRSSIEYARKQAEGMRNAPEYRVANYLDWNEREQYRAVLLIYEDFGVLNPSDRSKLLANIRSALCAGGMLVLDVASETAFRELQRQPARNWHALENGFWRPHPHLVLEERFLYPEIPASCDQYAVYDGRWTVYRVHQTYYTPESIASELVQNGFIVEDALSNLAGEEWSDASMQVGVVCRKKQD